MYNIMIKINNNKFSIRKLKKYIEKYKSSSNYYKLGKRGVMTYSSRSKTLYFNFEKGEEISVANILRFIFNNYKGYIYFYNKDGNVIKRNEFTNNVFDVITRIIIGKMYNDQLNLYNI